MTAKKSREGNFDGPRRWIAGRMPRYVEFRTSFERTDKYMDEHIDEWLSILSDMGEGLLWQGWESPNGGKRVYRVLPDREALKYLIDRHLYRQTTETDLSLTGAKILSEQERVVLMRAQTEVQKAQSEYTKEQTEAFRRSVITPEMAERLIRSTMQFCIGLLQNLSDEDWNRAVHYESRQKMLLRIAQKMTRKAEEDIETLDENFTIDIEGEDALMDGSDGKDA